MTDTSDGGPSGPILAQSFMKRVFDLVGAVVGLLLTGWIIAISYVIASIDTGGSGFFTQERIGCGGRRFRVIKIRTMRVDQPAHTNVTTREDPRITRFGRIFRRIKIDELPQLINVLKGDMSFVGPRPEVPGYADCLEGPNRLILAVRPGITGPATLKYRNEEALLAAQPEPQRYNDEVIFPDKVRINRKYVEDYSFLRDLRYIWHTVVGGVPTDLVDDEGKRPAIGQGTEREI